MSDSDLLSIFRVEAGEYLESLNSALLQVEMLDSGDPTYQKTLIEMNRIAHSMKGAARAVGIPVIETLSHYMEDIFDNAMRGKLKLLPDICDSIYDGLDLIQNVMDGETPDSQALGVVLARFEQIIAGNNTQTDSQQVATVPTVDYGDVVHGLDEIDDDEDDEPTERITPVHPSKPTVRRPPPDPLKPPKNTTTQLTPAVEVQTMSMRPLEETVRVTVGKLDSLMAEVTELIVARMHGDERLRAVNELRSTHARWQREWRNVRSAYIRLVRRMQDERGTANSEITTLFKFLETNQRYLSETNRRLAQLAQAIVSDNLHLATLSDELQENISGMRLIPFDTLVPGYQRLVRDLSRDTGKLIQFDVIGAFVEIDKTVLDALKDPILHLLRNAVDHGVGTPDEREKIGKSPVGRIVISVEQRGSEIVLSVSDDGRGIDPEKVRRSIVRAGLLSEVDASALTDDEARFYVFHPGFSTSEAVTALSGRGMGMDIVRERVEGLRGRVSLQSDIGSGTTVTINVPVSLTRIRCILFQLGDHQYAIPSVVVMRMEKLPRTDVFTAEGQEMIVVNNQPTPLVSMAAVLGVTSAGGVDGVAQVMIVQAANRTVALEVDRLLSEQELVLKPLGPELSGARFVSGAALLGDSSVIIVLDANDIVRAASGIGFSGRRRLSATMTMPVVKARKTRVLVVDDSITTRTLEKNILETAGFDVHVAVDGTEAWSMLTESKFDVVVSDVEMPKMNGLELTRRIKSSPHTRDIPVILLTSLGKEEQREAGLRAGADSYLVKSAFDQSELLETIQSVL